VANPHTGRQHDQPATLIALPIGYQEPNPVVRRSYRCSPLVLTGDETAQTFQSPLESSIQAGIREQTLPSHQGELISLMAIISLQGRIPQDGLRRILNTIRSNTPTRVQCEVEPIGVPDDDSAFPHTSK
jgi:hypothetical protein